MGLNSFDLTYKLSEMTTYKPYKVSGCLIKITTDTILLFVH